MPNLRESLEIYYDFEGNRNDSHSGGYHLQYNNTYNAPSYASGINGGQAVDFVGGDPSTDSNLYLTSGSKPAALDSPVSFSFCHWLKLDVLPNTIRRVINNEEPGFKGWLTWFNASNQLLGRTNDGITFRFVLPTTVFTAAKWYYYSFRFNDIGSRTVRIYDETALLEEKILTIDPHSVLAPTTADFIIGGLDSARGNQPDITIDKFGYWSRYLSDNEDESMWNNGKGRKYSQLSGAGALLASGII